MTGPAPRVALYERLPEIYRIRDAEQLPAGQLRAFLRAVEDAFGAVHESIEALYDDLFIDTCDDWVIPYIADLVGTSHLSGDPRTLRADVADTIALRRRKGTGSALERLAANLTGWPCRAVELFGQLAWSQHLNHQRPDAGGRPPYGGDGVTRFTVPRGGTPPLRDPAMLSLLGTPFDPFAHLPDVKRADDGALHVNLPNVAIFLWRLAAYRIPVAAPLAKGVADLGPQPAGSGRARYGVRLELDARDRPVTLFNTYRSPPLDATASVHALTSPDAVPGAMLQARLDSDSEAGNPAAYVTVDRFDATTNPPTGLDVSDAGLQLYVPDVAVLNTAEWTFRGDNLCAWEKGLRRPLEQYEIVVDPRIGRVLVGTAVAAERDALHDSVAGSARMLAGYTYGAVGPVGAHPVSRAPAPKLFAGVPVGSVTRVSALPGATSLQSALGNLQNAAAPVVVEITDSNVHALDPATLPGAVTENGAKAIALAHSLVIRAAGGQRPTIMLAAPLGFRPADPGDPSVAELTVRLEGVFLAGSGVAASGPLIGRAAVARLELDGCTIDPGGHRLRDGSRAPLVRAMALDARFGFAAGADLDAFEPTPEVILQRTVTGALRIDDRYRLTVEASIVDGGRGPGEPADAFAVSSLTDPATGWGPALAVRGAHFLGRVRCGEAIGSGGLFAHRLEVRDHQRGCLKHCCFSGQGDRLPPHHACVLLTGAQLELTSSVFGDAGYGQITLTSDHRIRDRGPGDDAMGAYGFLLEAHKWINLATRLREFMPAGARPLPIAVT